jgi:multiple sugar transport system substrate-binding protein
MQAKNTTLYIFVFLCIAALPFVFAKKRKGDTNKVIFWQYWSGTEKEPLEDLVAKFNSEDHDFEVEMLSISMPRKKILMAIAAGVPPDLIHIDGDMVIDLGLRGGLLDLGNVVDQQDYIPIYLEMLNVNGKQYAMPLMPTCDAMHINKGLLDEYGLAIPKTLDDIVATFDIINDPSLAALQPPVAWLPSWPPWAGKFIVSSFGGSWGDANGVTANLPENIAAWSWVQDNFASKIPKDKLAAFTEGFHAYQSPDNPFYSGRIAIENSGVWEHRLAGIFAPNMEVVVAPFPSFEKTLATLVNIDALAIPLKAKHPQEAQQFIKWLHKQENLEYLALAQGKFTPLKNHSAEFFSRHENPYINIFIELSNSPHASYFPQVDFANRYKREIKAAYLKVLRMEASAQEVLDELQEKFEPRIRGNVVKNSRTPRASTLLSKYKDLSPP